MHTRHEFGVWNGVWSSTEQALSKPTALAGAATPKTKVKPCSIAMSVSASAVTSAPRTTCLQPLKQAGILGPALTGFVQPSANYATHRHTGQRANLLSLTAVHAYIHRRVKRLLMASPCPHPLFLPAAESRINACGIGAGCDQLKC